MGVDPFTGGDTEQDHGCVRATSRNRVVRRECGARTGETVLTTADGTRWTDEPFGPRLTGDRRGVLIDGAVYE